MESGGCVLICFWKIGGDFVELVMTVTEHKVSQKQDPIMEPLRDGVAAVLCWCYLFPCSSLLTGYPGFSRVVVWDCILRISKLCGRGWRHFRTMAMAGVIRLHWLYTLFKFILVFFPMIKHNFVILWQWYYKITQHVVRYREKMVKESGSVIFHPSFIHMSFTQDLRYLNWQQQYYFCGILMREKCMFMCWSFLPLSWSCRSLTAWHCREHNCALMWCCIWNDNVA